MRIGILGGSFDPPHIGHITIAMQTKEHMKLDQVWLMPCFTHPFRKQLSSPAHRLAMTRYFERENIKVSDFEITQKRTSYTFDTLTQLSMRFPQHTFSWIIGSDHVATITKWKKWQELLSNYRVIVYPKQTGTTRLQKNMIGLPKDTILTTISSTMVRLRVAKGLSLRYLVDDKTAAYIKKYELYQKT